MDGAAAGESMLVRVGRLTWAAKMQAALREAGHRVTDVWAGQLSFEVHVNGFEVVVLFRDVVRLEIDWTGEGRPDTNDYLFLSEVVQLITPMADEYDAAFARGEVAP